MVKSKAPAPASTTKSVPTKAALTKAEAAKAARNARQPDLLDLLTEEPKAMRTRARKGMSGFKQ
jgi:hypothetical protein